MGKRISVIIFTAIFSFISIFSSYTFAENEKPIINIGARDIAVSVSYNNGTITENLISDSNGEVVLDELYSYLVSLGWGSDDPQVLEASVNYRINYPGDGPAQKDAKPNGNGRYTDATGTLVLTPDNWLDKNDILIKEIKYVEGIVVKRSLSGNEESVGNYPVKIGDKTFTSDATGNFTTYPILKEEDCNNLKVSASGDEYYEGYNENYDIFKTTNKVVLTEREAATKSDYSYGDNVSDNGYVASPGTYTVNGEKGNTLSLSLNGPFNSSINVPINENGLVPKVYVKSPNGDISAPVENILRLDQSAPVITGVDTVRETSGNDLRFLLYGIFTKEFADINLDMTIEDADSGINKIYLYGINKETGNQIIYQPVNMTKNGNKFNVSFEIKGDDFNVLENLLKVIAEDKVGNKSDLRLVRMNETASTLVIEKIKPTINNVEVIGNKTKNGWYNDAVNIKFNVQDKESGLYNLRVTLNGKDVLNKEFYSTRNVDNNAMSFNITKEHIESLINANGSYEAFLTLTDNSGNITTLNKKVNIDIVKPEITLSGISNNGNYNYAPTLHIHNDEKHYTVNGAYVQVTVKRNGKVVADKKYENQNEIDYKDFAADGKYEVTVFAEDAAGNVSSKKTVHFIKDTVKPALALSNINKTTKNGWYNSPVKLTFNTKDSLSGIENIKLKINGTEISSRDFSRVNVDNNSVVLSITEDYIKKFINNAGSYNAEIIVTDNAGNVAKMKKVCKIDIVKPVVSISGITKGKHYRESPVLNIKNSEKHFGENGAYIMVVTERDGKIVGKQKYASLSTAKFDKFDEDGNYKLTIYAVDAAGNKSDEKKISFVKDTTKPVITISGAKDGGIYNTAKNISIGVNERYYKTNKVTIKVTRTVNGKTTNIKFPWSNDKKNTVHNKVFSQTGTYKITVNATDESGNKAETKTITFTVDTVAPKITIKNVKKGAYGKDDKIAPEIHIYDDFYKSHKVTLTRNGAPANIDNYLEKTNNGGTVRFKDFPKQEKYDGIYKLTVVAYDKAGNKSQKEIEFSVNRFGSTFRYNKNILELVASRYVKRVDKDLIITEYNISGVKDTISDVKYDGVASKIKAKTSEKAEETHKTYTHVYKKIDFEKEGIYTVNIISKDKLNNTAESQKKAGKVNFAVDRTAPRVTLDKDIDNGSFDANTINVTAKIMDSISPASAKVFVNGEQIESQKFNKNTGELKFSVPEGRNNKVTITAKDLAGNSKVYKYSNITVSTNAFVRIAGNRWLYIGAGAILLAGLGFFIFNRKKKKPKENVSSAESH